MSFTFCSWRWTLVLSPPPVRLPHVTTVSSSKIAAKAVNVECICLTVFSWSWTVVLSPPQKASPHVTTVPLDKTAAKAYPVECICFTVFSWCWTVVLSPPKRGSPHVTTVSSAKTAAKAADVECICFTFSNWSWTLVLSPPRSGWPQVTTVSLAKIAAKAGAVECICFTFFSWSWTLRLILPPQLGRPQVTTVPSAKIAAKARSVESIFQTFLSLSWTLVLSPPLFSVPQVTTLCPPTHHKAKAQFVAAMCGCCAIAVTLSPSFKHWRASVVSKRLPSGAASFKNLCWSDCCARSLKSSTVVLSWSDKVAEDPLGKDTWMFRVPAGSLASTLRLLPSRSIVQQGHTNRKAWKPVVWKHNKNNLMTSDIILCSELYVLSWSMLIIDYVTLDNCIFSLQAQKTRTSIAFLCCTYSLWTRIPSYDMFTSTARGRLWTQIVGSYVLHWWKHNIPSFKALGFHWNNQDQKQPNSKNEAEWQWDLEHRHPSKLGHLWACAFQTSLQMPWTLFFFCIWYCKSS